MATSNSKIDKAEEKNENEIALRETQGLSQGQIILRRFVRHKAAMASLFSLILFVLFVF
jgi:peptide/nickel transport system permease protein